MSGMFVWNDVFDVFGRIVLWNVWIGLWIVVFQPTGLRRWNVQFTWRWNERWGR